MQWLYRSFKNDAIGVINFEHVNADWEAQCQGIKVS